METTTTQTTAQPIFQSGETITALFVNPARSTSKKVYTLKEKEDGWYIYQPHWSFPEHISALKHALIFKGNNLDYKVDSEYDCYADNWGINIVSKDDPETIRNWLTTNNLNPHFSDWENIYLCPEKPTLDSVYKRLFKQ